MGLFAALSNFVVLCAVMQTSCSGIFPRHNILRHKYYFTSRVVNVWNSLPSFVVSAVTVNCFKSRLDKFWKNQEIIYDYHAHIQGTGNRSEVVV